jgi:type II secretory pathway pseudopilin PulG
MSVITDSLKFPEKLWVPLAVSSAVILLAAAIAIPNLLRSRGAAEASLQASRARRAEESTLSSVDHMYAEEQAAKAVLHAPAAVSLPTAGLPAAQSTLTAADKAASKSSSATIDRKLVRTGSLELTVKSPADAAEQIRLMAESMGGYLETAQIGGTKDAPTADITIRVPAARFSDATLAIRKLAARVESEKTDAQDVTRQYVDMEARLRNLRAEEAQYLVIMKSAYKVGDLLEVSEKLSEVRGQIEQQQAEFQTLSRQVETVAITISLRALADAQVFGLNWRPLYQLKVAARDGLDAMADYAATMAAVLFYVPVALAWSFTLLFAAWIGSRLVRWTGRRFFDWPAVAAGKAANSI